MNLRPKTRTLALPLFMLTTALALVPLSPAFAVDSLQTPVGENVVAGAATFARPSAGTLNVNQSTDRAVINWDSFDIGSGASTRFFQPGPDSLAVNRVTGDGDGTQIMGSLQANGNVMVLDRNGVLFGKNAQVDVGGIIATTGSVNNADIMDGNDTFVLRDMLEGTVENRGKITVSESGLAALVSPIVMNSGVINARLGKIALASGNRAVIDLTGDDLVTMEINSDLRQALIEHRGHIDAEGGVITIATSTAEDVLDNSINMAGVATVSSVTMKGGTIVLQGAQDTTVSGRLLANSEVEGGNISIDSHDVGIGSTARIHADSTFDGVGGAVTVNAGNSIDVKGRVSANGEEGGGAVTLAAGDNLGISDSGRVDARATGASKGGKINITSGGDETLIAGRINAGGIDEGGTINISAANRLTTTEESRIYNKTLSTGQGGSVTLNGGEAVLGGRINVDGMEGGGAVNVNSNSVLALNGNISGEGVVVGKGAKVNLNAADALTVNGRIFADGRSGGGTVAMSGDTLTLAPESRVYVRGLDSGLPDFADNPGGTVTLNAAQDLILAGIVNADGFLNGGGTINASGSHVDLSGRLFARALGSGNGGTITLSRPNTIDPAARVNVSSVNGADGTFSH